MSSSSLNKRSRTSNGSGEGVLGLYLAFLLPKKHLKSSMTTPRCGECGSPTRKCQSFGRLNDPARFSRTSAWSDQSARLEWPLRVVLGSVKNGGESSNEIAYSGPGDQVAQQTKASATMSKTDHTNTSHSSYFWKRSYVVHNRSFL